MREIWKDVVGFDGRYEVSNTGKVRSNSSRRSFILKQNSRKHGYLAVEIKSKAYSVHRIVAMAFIPNPDNKPMVNHLDGIKTNNFDFNLEWCTHSENCKHSFAIGTQCNKGNNHPRHIITEDQAKEIKKLINAGGPRGFQRKIAKSYGISEYVISKIKHGHLWNY